MTETMTPPASKPLPPKQQECFDTIKEWIATYGFPPSLSEVAKKLGVAKPTAQSHVGKLINKGLVSRVEGRLVLDTFTPTLPSRQTVIKERLAPRAGKTRVGAALVPAHKINVRVTEDAVLVERGVDTPNYAWATITIVDGKFKLDSND